MSTDKRKRSINQSTNTNKSRN